MSGLRTVALLASAVLLLGACASPPPAPTRFPPLSFARLGTVGLDVATVDFVAEYQPPLAEPHVDHLAPTTPLDAVRTWATERFQPTGSAGDLRVIVKDARIVAVPLPRTTGLKGAVTKDQAERFEGRLEVELQAYSPARLASATTSATVTRAITVPEDATLADRDLILLDLTRKMVEDLNAQIDEGIARHFAALRS